SRDVVGLGWDARTAVLEHGGAAAIAHDSMAYFSHAVDDRVYSVRLGEDGFSTRR
ncbi:hypothetical protein BJ912DRAFT_848336, partial [Pholiota molesta]